MRVNVFRRKRDSRGIYAITVKFWAADWDEASSLGEEIWDLAEDRLDSNFTIGRLSQISKRRRKVA